MIRRRRPFPTAVATQHPLDDEDLLTEILLRLPPQPSSLPRASAVCKRWCRIVRDARFVHLFRDHHRKIPLLGFFMKQQGVPCVFSSTLDPPDRIPAARFCPPNSLRSPSWVFRGCRNGLAMFLNWGQREVLLWDPQTNQQRHVSFPLPRGFTDGPPKIVLNAGVVCVDGHANHLHGACLLSPFKLVVVCNDPHQDHAYACLFDSGSGTWGDLITVEATTMNPTIDPTSPSILVGNKIYRLLYEGDILQFDLERESLSMIGKPIEVCFMEPLHSHRFQIVRTEDSSMGLTILLGPNIQIWEWKPEADSSWVMRKSIQLGNLLTPRLSIENGTMWRRGYDEETNSIFLTTDMGDFIVQLETMQLRSLAEIDQEQSWTCYTYANHYTTGRETGGGEEADMSNDRLDD